MSKMELYGWPVTTQGEQPCEQNPSQEMSASQRKERISILLRHSRGASIQELMTLTKSDAAQVRNCIRQIIDEGGEVDVDANTESNGQVFYLTN